MAGEVYALYNQYQQKHPYSTKEAIADMMLKDGVITKKVADKIKSGTSLFLLDDYTKKPDNNIDMTEIMGGNFTKKPVYKRKSKTNFNRKIEPTFQSEKQGDCWLLSDINALNQTEWGRKAIYDAILPDGNGNVTIRFEGSPIKQKSFRITEQEIVKARKSGRYSRGDDDMIAFELATEKLAKLLIKSGKYKRCEHFDDKDPGHISYISGGAVYDKDGKQIDISELITGRKDVELPCQENSNVTKSFIKSLAENGDSVSCVCTFLRDILSKRAKNSPVHGGHAYAIKKIVHHKYVILIDPYHADKVIKLPWNDFVSDVESLYVATKNETIKDKLDKLIPAQIKNEIEQSYKDSAKRNDYDKQKEIDVNIVNNIFPQVVKILMSFGINSEDILFTRINSIIRTDFLKNEDFRINYNVMHMESRDESRKPSTKDVNKDNVLLLLEIKPDFIAFLDKYKSGWGKGKEKKELIIPIINALAEKAKEVKIDSKTIEDFKKKCMRELDATFYTDEKVIQREVEKMVKLIKSKSNT